MQRCTGMQGEAFLARAQAWQWIFDERTVARHGRSSGEDQLRLRLLVIDFVVEAAAATQYGHNTPGDATQQVGNLRVRRRGNRHEPRLGVDVVFIVADEHTVGNEDVKMKRQLQRGVEALDERGAAVGIRARWADPKFSRAPSLEREDRAENFAQHLSCELRIGCQMPAHSTRKRRNPLAHWRAWEHAVDQMRSGVVHAARCARRADSAAFTREGHQVFGAAATADHARKPVRENAAAEIRLELAIDMSRQTRAERACFGERTPQPFQLGGHGLVNQRALRRASAVLGHRGFVVSTRAVPVWSRPKIKV